MKRYFISVHLFKKVNPKSFNNFDFYPVDKKEDFRLYMEKGMIVKFNGDYFQYAGMNEVESTIPNLSVINVKSGKNLLFSMDAN